RATLSFRFPPPSAKVGLEPARLRNVNLIIWTYVSRAGGPARLRNLDLRAKCTLVAQAGPHVLRHTPLKRACLPISPLRQIFCAQDWTRTSTPVKALPPQSSVSTNFTTWA